MSEDRLIAVAAVWCAFMCVVAVLMHFSNKKRAERLRE